MDVLEYDCSGATPPPKKPLYCDDNPDFEWCDITKSIDERVALLVKEMTTSEKEGLFVNSANSVPRLNMDDY